MNQKKRRIKRMGNQCVACGSTEELTVDHIVPRSLVQMLGLDPNKDNLQVLCLTCNTKKGNRLQANDPETVRILKRYVAQWEYLNAPPPVARRKYVFRNLSVVSLTPETYYFTSK